ncbi:MAG: trigger factor [Actinomycetota bacterium]|nr:trigger factor [Actinomycetota bacterium]
MKATVEELPESKVRLTVEVPSAEVEHAIDHAASDLAGNLKIPGFRKGKVPMPVLLARVGRERLYAEAVESHIGGWFRAALRGTNVRPASTPEYGYDLPSSPNESFEFTATVDVQPKPTLPDWTALQVPAPEAEVPEELIDAELEVLRSSVADLAPVEGRPAREGDVLLVDLASDDGEAQRDYVVELGSQRLLPELEARLVGIQPGEQREIAYELPDGQAARVTAIAKELYEKVLPPVDDELARAASEFTTIAELREEIEERMRSQIEAELESRFRAAAADALVDATDLQIADGLVQARAVELWNGLVRSLERRGISAETYLQVSGRTPQQIQADIEEEARRSLAREIVLEAAADEAGIEITDAEVEELVREQAEDAGEDPDALLVALRESGRFEAVRSDLRLRAALDRVAGEVQRISPDLADARERLWTPEKEKPETATKLWTPGSKEPA